MRSHWEGSIYEPGNSASLDTELPCALILDISNFRNVREEFLLFTSHLWGIPRWLSGKKSTNPGDKDNTGLIPGLGRYPGGGNGNPLQYSCWRIPWTEEPGRQQSTGSLEHACVCTNNPVYSVFVVIVQTKSVTELRLRPQPRKRDISLSLLLLSMVIYFISKTCASILLIVLKEPHWPNMFWKPCILLHSPIYSYCHKMTSWK